MVFWSAILAAVLEFWCWEVSVRPAQPIEPYFNDTSIAAGGTRQRAVGEGGV